VVSCIAAIAAWPSLGQAATLRLAIENMAFAELPTSARVGDAIEWFNQDVVPHTVTARDGSFDIIILPGKTGVTTVRTPGRMAFYCRYHPTMVGKIDVHPG
jgi:plastocyanin